MAERLVVVANVSRSFLDRLFETQRACANRDAVAILQRPILVGGPVEFRKQILPILVAFVRQTKTGARPLRQLAGSRNKIRVNVGFRNVGDPQPFLRRRLQVLLDVAIRVNDDGLVGLLTANQITRLSNGRLEKPFHKHREIKL